MLTLTAIAVPRWVAQAFRRYWLPDTLLLHPSWVAAGVLLLLGLALAIPLGERGGLIPRGPGRQSGLVFALCAIPVLLTAIVYPQLPERPFASAPASMWLLSPIAQEVFFLGGVYGRLSTVLREPSKDGVRVPTALLVTAAFFALWHLPNAWSVSAGYLTFQLVYTFTGFTLTGMSRHLTKTIWYAAAAHMAVNFIARAAA